MTNHNDPKQYISNLNLYFSSYKKKEINEIVFNCAQLGSSTDCK